MVPEEKKEETIDKEETKQNNNEIKTEEIANNENNIGQEEQKIKENKEEEKIEEIQIEKNKQEIEQEKVNSEEKNENLDKNDPDSIYNWVAKKISGPSFRNIIKDFIDDNCSLFIDIEENTFQQGQIFNEFNQLLENILGDVLEEGGLTQEQFLEAAQKGLEDKKYKKYFDQLLNFGDYNFFKRCMTKRNYTLIKRLEEQIAQENKEIEEQKLEEEKRK